MNSLTSAQLKETISTLLSRTSSGKAKWVMSDVIEEFSTETDKFSFLVYSRDADDSSPFVFEIYLKPTTEGSEPIQVAVASSRPQNPLNNSLRQLYAAARLSLLGVNDLASELSDDLDD